VFNVLLAGLVTLPQLLVYRVKKDWVNYHPPAATLFYLSV